MKNGEGVWRFNDGSYARGFFENDELIEGMFVSKKSHIDYRGMFKDFKMHGKGKLFYPDGKVYEGEFKYGKPDGEGILIKGGKTYKGKFKNGKQEGEGVFYSSRKHKGRRGRWRNGKRIEWFN